MRIEDLDPARHVVGHRDQLAVLADRTTDAVAALDQAFVDALLEQIDLGQAAVAAEHIGVALVAGKHRRGMGQIAQPVDARQGFAGAAVDDLHAGAGAFHHQAQVASAAQRCLGTGGQQQRAGGG
ncbi:hypothetical protein D3C76_1470070 [compost metagenome]